MNSEKVIQVGNYIDDTNRNFKNPQQGRVYSPLGLSPTLKCCCGGHSKIIINKKEDMKQQTNFQLPKELEGKTFRIRKLTNRECYRLQGCDEETIDTLLATDISRSKHYALAGNSITVDVLFHIFRKMFIEPENEDQQLYLF